MILKDAARQQGADDLVPGRECGSCQVCCITPTIDTPEMQKKPGLVCSHCAHGPGCDIYANRPQVCRDFICAWRKMAILGPEWQPDKCGVLVEFQTDGIPPHFANKNGYRFTLVGNPLKTVRQPWFIDFIATGIVNNTPLFLVVPGPPGRVAAKALLNTRDMVEAASRSRGHVKEMLEKALKSLSNYHFVEYELINTGNDTGT